MNSSSGTSIRSYGQEGTSTSSSPGSATPGSALSHSFSVPLSGTTFGQFRSATVFGSSPSCAVAADRLLSAPDNSGAGRWVLMIATQRRSRASRWSRHQMINGGAQEGGYRRYLRSRDCAGNFRHDIEDEHATERASSRI